MGNTPPKFGVGGVRCELWRTKCIEGDTKGEMDGEEKNTIPAKNLV